MISLSKAAKSASAAFILSLAVAGMAFAVATTAAPGAAHAQKKPGGGDGKTIKDMLEDMKGK